MLKFSWSSLNRFVPFSSALSFPVADFFDDFPEFKPWSAEVTRDAHGALSPCDLRRSSTEQMVSSDRAETLERRFLQAVAELACVVVCDAAAVERVLRLLHRLQHCVAMVTIRLQGTQTTLFPEFVCALTYFRHPAWRCRWTCPLR